MALRLAPVQTLSLSLSLTGGACETIFPRTERALNKCVNAQRLICKLVEDSYNSIVDAILGLVSEEWNVEIQAYYDDQVPQLRYYQSAETIAAIDDILCPLVRELAALERYGWDDCDLCNQILFDAMRTFVGCRLPSPERCPLCLETHVGIMPAKAVYPWHGGNSWSPER